MTISKTNFIAISVTMITVLILFQFSNLSAIYTSEAMNNKNAAGEIEITADKTIQSDTLKVDTAYSTAIIGDISDREANIAEEWCTYTKRSYNRFANLEEYSMHSSSSCKLLITSSDAIESKKDVNILIRQSKAGIHIILTSLPETSFIEASESFQKLLGIRSIYKDSYKLNGLTMYEGFLLGGKTTYPKLKKTIPYFRLQAGTKTYVIGEIRQQKRKKIKNEDLPPVVWRNQAENSFIFVVNCDFFKDHTGLGMLSAMYSETQDYYLYPIVNAQNVICQNFPYLSNENKEEVSKHYYHSSKSLCENVLWPDIVSILSATGDKFNGMIAPKLEYSKSEQGINEDSVSFYFEQNEKVTGELGLSGDQLDSYSYYDEKIKEDTRTFQKLASSYTFTIFAPGDMSEAVYQKYLDNQEEESVLSSVRTLLTKKEKIQKPILSFYNNEILSMASTIDGFSHTNAEDLYLRSIETALGYSSVSLDFTRVLYPESKKDDWTHLSKNLSRYLNTYWSQFRKGFEQTTVSQTDKKVRNFFSMNYTTFRHDKTINLSISRFHEGASYLLNLNNERIVSIAGASFIELERGRYVIIATDKNVSMEVSADSIE